LSFFFFSCGSIVYTLWLDEVMYSTTNTTDTMIHRLLLPKKDILESDALSDWFLPRLMSVCRTEFREDDARVR